MPRRDPGFLVALLAILVISPAGAAGAMVDHVASEILTLETLPRTPPAMERDENLPAPGLSIPDLHAPASWLGPVLHSHANELAEQVLSKGLSGQGQSSCTPPATAENFDVNEEYANSWIKFHVATTPLRIDWYYVWDGPAPEGFDRIRVRDTQVHEAGTGTWCWDNLQRLQQSELATRPGDWHMEIYFGGNGTDRSGVKQCAGANAECNYPLRIWPKIVNGSTYGTTPGDGKRTFRASDGHVRVYTDWDTSANAYNQRINYRWYRPDGTLHNTSQGIDLLKGHASRRTATSLNITETSADAHLGDWKVQAWIDPEDPNLLHDVTYSFKITNTNASPNVPTNPKPGNGTTGAGVNVDGTWSGGDPDGDTLDYTVRFGTSNPPSAIKCTTRHTSCDFGTLNYSSTYYWKVSSSDGTNTTHGPVWSFKTTDQPNRAPYQPWSPTPGGAEVPVDRVVTASWSGGDPDGDAVTYTVKLNTTNPPSGTKCTTQETTCSFGALAYNTTYYWSVTASDGSLSDAGPVWSFRVKEDPPPLEAYEPSPRIGADNIDRRPLVSWRGGDPDDQAVSYAVYIGTSNPPPHRKCWTQITSCDLGQLDWLTTYYWRVDTHDGKSVTRGPVWSFTVRPNPPPTVPSNGGPMNGQPEVPIGEDLIWENSTDQNGDPLTYEVYLDSASPPSNLICRTTENTCDPGLFSWATKYHWRVSVTDGTSTVWTNIWNFTTIAAPEAHDDYHADFELDTDGWNGTGLWHRVAPVESGYVESFASNASFWFGSEDTGTYTSGGILPETVTSPPIPLETSNPMLVFATWYETQDTGITSDTKKVYISNDGGTWTLLGSVSGDAAYRKWAIYYQDLTTYSGTTIHLRFEFTADLLDNGYRGWYVDEIRIFDDLDQDLLSRAFELSLGADPDDSDSDNDGRSDFADVRATIEDNPPHWENGTEEGNQSIGEIYFTNRGYADARIKPPLDASTIEGIDMGLRFNGTVGGQKKTSWVREHLIQDPVDDYFVGRFPLPEIFDGGNATNVSIILAMKDVHGNRVVYSGDVTLDDFNYNIAWNTPDLLPDSFNTSKFADINRAPQAASRPHPLDGADHISILPTVNWTGGDPDGDSPTYSVYVGTASPPTELTCETEETSCMIGPLAYETTYYWQVVAEDATLSTPGPVWSFTTIPDPCLEGGCGAGGGGEPTPCSGCGTIIQSAEPWEAPGADDVIAATYVLRLPPREAVPPAVVVEAPPLLEAVALGSGVVQRIAIEAPPLPSVLVVEHVGTGPVPQAVALPNSLRNRVWMGMPQVAVNATDKEVQSFIWGADVNGHILGDTIAGLLVYGDVRDIALGLYEGDSVQFSLGIIGLGLTFVPVADSIYSPARALIKIIPGDLGRLLSNELMHVVGTASIADANKLIVIGRYVGPDAIKAARLHRLEQLFPNSHVMLKISTAEEIEALDLMLKKYPDATLQKLTETGSRVATFEAMKTAAMAEVKFGYDTVSDLAVLAKVDGVSGVVNRLQANMANRLGSLAKGHAFELKAAAKLHTPDASPASTVAELNQHINDLLIFGERTRLDVDALQIQERRTILNELKAVKKLWLYRVKHQIDKMEKAVAENHGNEGRIIVEALTVVPENTKAYAAERGIRIYSIDDLVNALN